MPEVRVVENDGGADSELRNVVPEWLNQQQINHADNVIEQLIGSYVNFGGRQFSFADVEASFYRVHGEQVQRFEIWLNHFESHEKIYQWNQRHRFVYAKRLLDSAAKTFPASEEFCGSWRVMKIAFSKEFCRPVSGAIIHER